MADRVPRLSHLLETSIYVSDLDRAQGFYQRVFGLELFLRDDRMSALGLPGNAVLLVAWEGHLAAQGVPLESRITWPAGGTSLYVRDPDGSLLELATPGLWPSW